MKLLLLVAAVLLSYSSVFSRRGNPVIEYEKNIQYYVIDSDDDHPRKPTYSFLDTTYGTWVRVTGFTDPDTGHAQISSPPSTMTFPYGRKTITLPPEVILTNGIVLLDNGFVSVTEQLRILKNGPNKALPWMPFAGVFPLWADLEMRTTGDSSKVLYRVANDTCYINFYNFALRGTQGKIRATFQVVFAKPDSSITFNYRSFDSDIPGESAATIFQRTATIALQDTLARYATNYLDRGVYYAYSRAANPVPYEKDLHNGLAVKFIHHQNTLSLRGMTFPPHDGYELASSSFQPIVRLTQFTDSARMIYMFNEVVNTVTNARVYARLDSILVGAAQERGVTGPSVPIPCGSFRLTTTIYCPALGLDPWIHDNITTREFVRLSQLPFPHIEHFSQLDLCSYKVGGGKFEQSSESVMLDPPAPYLTGALVFDRRNAKGQTYRDSSSGGDTLTTSVFNLLGKSNVWFMFSYQRGLRQDSLHAGIRSRLQTGPEMRIISADPTPADGGDSLIIEALHSLGSTWNPAENRWVMIGAIVGSNDLETQKFRVQVPSTCIHNHSRFRIRLAARRHGPFVGLPFDDDDSYIVDGWQIVTPAASKAFTDLEPTGLTLGAKYYNRIPRDVKFIKPRVRIASNGLQATLAVYQAKLILRDQLGREVYNKRQSFVAPAPRTDVEVELPEWPIEGSQGGVFTAKVIIEQMFNDYLKANDTNTFYRKLLIDDTYGYDDGSPDTVGTMTAAHHSWFFYTFTPLRTDSLRGMEFFQLSASGQSNWVITFKDTLGNVRYTRSLSYVALERGFQRGLFSTPVPLSADSTYILQCNMTQGFALGGDASLSLAIQDTQSNTNPHYWLLHPDVLSSFSDNVSGGYGSPTFVKNGSAGGPLLPMMRLVYRGSATFLPVELLSLRAKRNALGSVLLDFATTSESNVATFSIERSTNTNTWEHVAELPAKNAMQGASYTHTDSEAPRGEVLYRLISHDLDGSSQNLGIVTAGALADAANALRVKPNPASSYIQLLLPSVAPNMHGSIYDEAGRIVQTFMLDGASQRVDLAGLAQGMYVVEVIIGGDRFRAKVWVTQKF